MARPDRHAEWMAEARSISFVGEQRAGVGTRTMVEARFGPLRTTDHMEFTAWEQPSRITVEHRDLFTGWGGFLLEEVGPEATRFTGREQIRFPWFLAGALATRPVFRWVWRRNLERLRRRLTGP